MMSDATLLDSATLAEQIALGEIHERNTPYPEQAHADLCAFYNDTKLESDIAKTLRQRYALKENYQEAGAHTAAVRSAFRKHFSPEAFR